ncbi:MAG: hypothetical protein JKY67_18560 [Pseudomonadales bacterium]|nr:hypothetical protein [Pseudomonadales bacterium]
MTRKEQFTPTVASTGAVSEVGAIAASLQTLQARNLLSHTPNLTDQEVFLDLNSHTATCNEYRLNAECRFDHQRYDIQSIETGVNSLSIKQLLNRLSEGESELNTKVGIVGHHFITQLMCAHCCKTLSVTPTLSRGFNRTSKSCPECGGALDFSGFHCLDFLTPNALSETQRDLPLAAFGISDNDILTVKTKTSTSHYQIGASQ